MTILERILASKREEVASLRSTRSYSSLERQIAVMPATRSLSAALAARVPVALIAEIKKASPSKGVIEPDFRPLEMARAYERAGAAAISVLTDVTYFQGGNHILNAVRDVTSLPLLRKDFIIDEIQVYEARAIGADALLLIVAALTDERLYALYQTALQIGLEVLIEVHSVAEWERAAPLHPALLGVNNRDLRTFAVDLGQTAIVAAAVQNDALLVSESGISTAADVDCVRRAGAKAILVGETLMRFGLQGAEQGIAQLLGEAT